MILIISFLGSVCSVCGKKSIQHGQLIEFNACHLSPVTGQTKCRLHLEKEEAEPEARMDLTVMTRSRSAGLKEVLTTKSGCRKKERITSQQKRMREREREESATEKGQQRKKRCLV